MQRIAIHGVPRSGTTWLGAIFDSSPNVSYRHQPLFSYAFKDYLKETSNKNDIISFFENIYHSNDDFINQRKEKKEGKIPEFSKQKITHIAYKEARYHHIIENLLKTDKNIKIVGIIRNPKSMIYSWYNAPKEFNKEKWSLIEEWRYANKKNQGKKEEFYGFEKWKEVANLFIELKHLYPNRFYLLRYSDLLSNPIENTQRVFTFCNLEFTNQTINFLKESSSKDFSFDAYSVFRLNQTDDKWKNKLDKNIINAIDNDLKGTNLEQFNN